ncbi:site-specific DNA-methyltransferase [Candidatus Saccharibacteria bacterium]|nr:site-specific DNA-methyltransferase [Candidatus Saccharibacteria bacterium]
MDNIEKIDLAKVSWRSSEDFFESLGEALDKLDDKDESYDFTWVGKRKAIIEAGAPVNKTIRPDVKNSKNWDTTENLFIEGDNLDALKLLQESYLGKVKMIYIDPPYNTGKDFVYHDNFKATIEQYDEDTEYKDESGNIQFKKNEKTNGRYHSDWLSMIYPRLKLARNLLTEDGVIFISIDDNEQSNLKKICDEVFGEDNFLAQVIWERAYSPVNLKKHFSESHDYILCYARDSNRAINNGLPRSDDADSRYMNLDNDSRGAWKSSDLSVGPAIAKNVYEITLPSGRSVTPPNGYSWRLSRERLGEFIADNRIWFGADGNSVPSIKRFLSEVKNTMTPMTIWKYADVGHSQEASQSLKKLFGDKAMIDYPKPVDLIKRCMQLYSSKDSIVLDFFSGSATTAHAVMQLNAEDGGNRKWIMVQLSEETDEKSEAFKAGYKTIPEIARERIRRAGDKIAAEHPDAKVDYGFRSLVVAETNYKEVYRPAGELQQSVLLDVVDNIKEDRSELDLLFGVLTASALELNRPLETRDIAGTSVYLYDYFGEVSGLVACFAESISEDTIKQIAALKPLTAVFRDSSFPDSQAKVNLAEHFRIISPETKVKVI